MAVSLSKEECIKKIDLRKNTLVNLTKDDPVLKNLKSRVAVVLDFSGSMSSFYRNGKVQELLEKLIPLALKFDDNGALDFWIFDDKFHRLNEVTMNNFYGFIENEIIGKYSMGFTKYTPVMEDVYEKYVVEEPREYPSYIVFITDGDCSDKKKAQDKIIEMANYNIFWQFIGMGDGSFSTLETLDDLSGRLIDNADFFSIPDLMEMQEEELYKKLMTEYPSYIEEAVNKGLIKKEKKIMAVSLSKGQKVSLAKVASDAGVSSLTKVIVGLGWDVNRYDGGADFDLDAAAFMLGANGKVRSESDFIFYNNKNGEGVTHTGDNKTGEGDGDDEQIIVDLNAVPADVDKISFTVTIDQADARNQNFGMVENSYIRIVDETTGTELVKYDLGEDYSIETAVVVAELYRSNGEWKFNAIGSGFQGGLAALCGNFGIDAE